MEPVELVFALFLTIWIPTDDGRDGGMAHAWVLDSGMAGADCIALLEQVTPAYALMGDGVLSCEQDHAEY